MLADLMKVCAGGEAALQYIRQRYDDFVITEARFVDMVPLLSGSPLD